MAKAYEVMTHALATCSPDENAANAAAIMKNRDIGNVLVVEDGKLSGIVTDRDLAIQALTGEEDPIHAPIRKYMSTNLITGEPDWDLDKVASTMAKYQIRRLPIIQDGQLAGIISLGDIARYEKKKNIVSKSLKAISTPTEDFMARHSGILGTILGLSLFAITASLMGWLTWSHNGREYRKQLMKSKLYHTAQQSVGNVRDKVDEVASSRAAKNIRRQVKANMKELSQQMPSIIYKPAKHKFAWFR